MTDQPGDTNVSELRAEGRAPRSTERRSFDHPSYGLRRTALLALAKTPEQRSA